jgi:hypothetical protein
MLEGSLIARISDAPARLTGMHWCFSATSLGTSLTTSPSMSNSFRLIEGTPYCLERKLVSSDSSMKPSLVRW